MIKNKTKGGNYFIHGLASFVCLAFSLCVAVYLFLGDIKTPAYDFILVPLLSVAACVGIYLAYDRFLTGISPLKRKTIIVLGVFALYLVISILTPFSPNHDAYDTMFFMKLMQSGNKMTEYGNAYMSFFATNRVMMWMYYPFTTLINGIYGIRLANMFYIWFSLVFVSSTVKFIAGQRASEISMIFMLPLCPFLLMSGPYIYPPAVFFCSLCFLLYMSKNIFAIIFFYIVAGALFTMRPLCLGPVLVYVFVNDISVQDGKRHFLKAFIRIISVLLVCILTKWYIAEVLYLTGVHPYPNMTSAADLWALEVGTRSRGAMTGLCSYMPIDIDGKPNDEIAKSFTKLWDYYVYAKPEDYNAVLKLQSDLRGMLFERAFKTVYSSPAKFGTFIYQKFNNYFADSYKPYFYALDLNSKNASSMLYGNYDIKYYLYENSVFFTFAICASFLSLKCLILSIRKRRLSSVDRSILILALGVVSTIFLSLLITEVGKRLMFDVMVPMSLLICVFASSFLKKKNNVEQPVVNKKPVVAICAVVGICSAIGVYAMYNKSNVGIFKDCRVEVTESNIYIKLKHKVTDKKSYIDPIGYDKVKLYGKDEIVIPNGLNHPVYARYYDNDGNAMIISKMRQIYGNEVFSVEEQRKDVETAESWAHTSKE